MNQSTAAKQLLQDFLAEARKQAGDVEPIRVLRCNAFRVKDANVLVRVAADTGKFFFGLNYINAEEVANLDNAYIAFVCGSVDNTIILPMQLFVQHLPQISHDRNGEFKIVIKKNLDLPLRGRGNAIPLKEYQNDWQKLSAESTTPKAQRSTAEESFHSVLQGRLLEVGNLRGLMTYCPNKTKKFNAKPLGELAKLEKCPELQFANYESLRNIDVLWFRQTGKQFYPERAFEVELSTGTWSGVGRLAALREYNTRLFVVSDEPKKFSQVMESQPEIADRFKNVQTGDVGVLYAAEARLQELRNQVGI
jgi:hypothetical protein